MKRILYFKGQPILNSMDGIEVQFQEGFHGRTQPELGEIKTGIMKVAYRKTAKKPFHIFPQGASHILITGTTLDTLSLQDANNEGDGLHFSVEDHYIIVKGLSFVMHGMDNPFKDPRSEYGLGYMQGRGAA